jgi:hypothetical protein
LTPIPGSVIIANYTVAIPRRRASDFEFSLDRHSRYVKFLYWTDSFSLVRASSVFVGEFCVLSSGKDRFHFARHYKNSDFDHFRGSFSRIGTFCWDREANYYHTLHDMILPLTFLPDSLLRDPGLHFVFPHLLPFAAEMLEILGLGRRVISLGEGQFIFAREVYHWQRQWAVCDSPEAAAKFRSLFVDLLGLDASAPDLSIWLNRKRGLSRHISNGDEVLNVLQTDWPAMNWTIPPPSRSVAQTARLFNRLWWVVAPHGAALTNLLFMQNRTGYCEIQADISGSSFIQMARVLGLWSLIARIAEMPHFGGGTVAGLYVRQWILPRETIMRIGELSAYLTMNTMKHIRPNVTYVNAEIAVRPWRVERLSPRSLA